MNFREYLGIDYLDRKPNGEEMSHQEKYRAIVNALGYEKVKRCVPFDIERIKKSTDPYLNDLPILQWDIASGFMCKGAGVIFIGSALVTLYSDIGVDSFSNSDGVCILKQCARMMTEE